MKVRVVLAALALMSPGAPTLANDVGFYVAGYVGEVTKESDRGEFDTFATDVHTFVRFTPTSDQRSFDDSDLGFAIIVGYRFTPHLALEGSYSRLGTVSHVSQASGNFPMDAGTVRSSVESETSGFTVSALGVLPLTRDWEVFGRAGALFATNEIKIALTFRGEVFVNPVGENLSESLTESSNDYFAGIGLGRRIFEIYDVRLEYQRLFDVGKFDTGGVGDIDAVLLGVTATF
jgi:OmpA-like transmembrane domain